MTSFVDPGVTADQHYKSIAVFTVGMGLAERVAAESAMEEWLVKAKVRPVRGMSIAPPTREYLEKELQEKIKASGVDAVLMLVLTSKDFINHQMPTTYHPGRTTGYVNFIGNTAYVSTQQSSGFTSGGGVVRKPIANYDLSLIDARSQKIVWKADGKTRGGMQHSYADLAASTGRTAITKLIADGLIKKKK
jgi:hypothetical protein